MNNPTIDGVSRELLERAWDLLDESQPGRTCNDLRALLDVPAVERQEDVQQYNATGQRVPVGCFVGREDFEALQSIVARLEARVAELESGRGDPVAWIKPDVAKTLLKDECCYAFGEQNPKGTLIPLFTAPPAPVAAKYQERVEFEKWIVGEWPTAPLRYVRDALPEDDPLHGTYCDEYLQRAWVGWQARACLDATAALNGVKS